jgi:ubiquinol-cytochrome c reductase cytochrome b subunit
VLLKRIYRWLDEQLGISDAILPIIRHPVPRDVNWWYVFGSATLAAFLVQVVTGVALAFTYVPAPNDAYSSLQFVTQRALMGNVVRGIHYFGSTAMVILIGIHAIQVFLMGAHKYPRQFNWLSGVFLLALTLGMAFTGQLLRWDQDGYWTVAVLASMVDRVPFVGTWLVQLAVAGQTIGGATLTRFYATHVFVIPAMIFALIGVHLYLVVRHGISELPRPGVLVDPSTYRQRYHELLKSGVPFWPDAAWKDVVFALAVGAIVVAFATLVGAPALGRPADPTIIQADPRPDWYFIWLFALLALSPPGLENLLILGFPVLLGVVLLLVPFLGATGERHPSRRPWAVGAVFLIVLTLSVLIKLGFEAPWSPDTNPGPLPVAVTQNLTGPAAQGAEVFQTKGCVDCHQIAGVGGRRGPDLTYVGDRLDANLLTIRIINGGGNMPAFGGNITSDQLSAVVAFLQQRRYQP